MEIYVSECGNSKTITTRKNENDRHPYAHYNGEEFLISTAFVSFLESDKKRLLENYEFFKTVHGPLMEAYEKKNYAALFEFIRIVINERNFHITLCSKPYMFAKIFYVLFHGRNHYSAAGYSALYISDVAKLNEEFMYPFMTAVKNQNHISFKRLLEVIRDYPVYYVSEGRNKFKDDVKKLLWRKDYSIYEKQLYELKLSDSNNYNKLFTLIALATLMSKWNNSTDVEAFKMNKIVMYHSDKYKYDQDKLIEMGVPYFNINYVKIEKNPILELIEDINKIVHSEFTKVIEIFRNNGDYKKDCFRFISKFFNSVTQANCEFQLPINEIATLMGIMDLVKDNIDDYYHDRRVIDFLIIAHYTRMSEYLKNHCEEKSATKIFRTRV